MERGDTASELVEELLADYLEEDCRVFEESESDSEAVLPTYSCSGCLFVLTVVLGIKVCALVDSGSCISILAQQEAVEMGIMDRDSLGSTLMDLVGISGNRLSTQGVSSRFADESICVILVVDVKEEEMVLGQGFLSKYYFNLGFGKRIFCNDSVCVFLEEEMGDMWKFPVPVKC